MDTYGSEINMAVATTQNAERIAKEIRAGCKCIVTAPRRSGKTRLVGMIVKELEGKDITVVCLSARQAEAYEQSPCETMTSDEFITSADHTSIFILDEPFYMKPGVWNNISQVNLCVGEVCPGGLGDHVDNMGFDCVFKFDCINISTSVWIPEQQE